MITSKSMKINDEYIESLIEGYTTIDATGREMLEAEQETTEIGHTDGSVFEYMRYTERTIEVSFVIEGKTREELLLKLRQLSGILNVTNAEFVFNDEPDVYYVGTIDGEPDVGITMGVSSDNGVAAGTFSILCSDPFKYSVVEYEAEASIDDPNSIFIDYGGTYKSHPVLEVDFYKEIETDDETTTELTGNGDCGYVAFFTEDEKIIQLGDPDEEDGQTIEGKSETLISQTFSKTSSWGSAAKALWAQNSGVVVPSEMVKTGSIGMKVATYTVPAKTKNTSGKVLSSAKSDVGGPYIYYSVSLYTSNRTTNSVKVKATITASLANSASYFLTGYGLKGSLYVGGEWHSVTIKKTSAQWRGKTAHTVNMSFTVTGLSSGTSSLSNIKFKVSRTDSYGTTGTLNERKCKSISISTYEASVPATYYLGASNYGTSTGKWHGPTIKRTVSESQDFSVTWKHRMSIGNSSGGTKQMGAFQLTLADNSGKVIVGIRILKSKAGKYASLIFYLNGVQKSKSDIDLSYNNKYLGKTGTCSINKSGSNVTFNIGGYKKTYNEDAIKDLKVSQLTVGFEQYSSVNALTYNGLTWMKYVRNNRDSWKDIPNKFTSNDVLEADCKDGEIYLNGNRTPSLGALGNDWEEFYLKPGMNQIGFGYSSWVVDGYAPTFKIRYREVFL